VRRDAIHPTLRTALAAYEIGLSVLPILADGSKRPPFRWKSYQQQHATLRELRFWFRHGDHGIAVITGRVSGGLEALDFDTVDSYQRWRKCALQQGLRNLHLRLTAGYLEASPGGMHLLYRCHQTDGNQKLATSFMQGTQRTLIETRGEGGLLIIAPSCGQVHPSGKPYVLLHGSLASIQTITATERQALFAIARSFDQCLPDQCPSPAPTFPPIFPYSLPVCGQRPGDCYNQQATWEEVLAPHGWKRLSTCNGEGYWQRPGKEGSGVSATTNYAGTDRLWVFSTSTCFEVARSYDKFGAYTVLNHAGNFSAAARDLARHGFHSNI
jgi:hypothetical protein